MVTEFVCASFLSSCRATEYDEEYEDVTVKQMLAPRSQETDTTLILNNLLKDYDKKLRPDIGGELHFPFFNQQAKRHS